MADLEKIGLDGSDFTIPAGGATAGVTTFNGRNGAVVPQSGDYSAALVGLGNVDNTSDADKPVSTAMQAALDLKANAADMTTALAAKVDTASLATVATSGSYNDLSDKPTIPAAYTLPTASAGELGGVKIGSGLTIDLDGTLNATGGGGGSVTVDTGLDENSNNPVTNAAITQAIDALSKQCIDNATAINSTDAQVATLVNELGDAGTALADLATTVGTLSEALTAAVARIATLEQLLSQYTPTVLAMSSNGTTVCRTVLAKSTTANP